MENNKLKRPHGESLARAPPEARRQPVVKEPAEGERRPRVRDYDRPTADYKRRKEAEVRRPSNRGWGTRVPAGAVVAPAVQVAPSVAAEKKKKKAPKKNKEKPKYTYNTYGHFSNHATIYAFNGDFNKRTPDPLTGTFASVHGYKYSRHTNAPKVVKPIELLQFYGERQAQALQDVLAELARLEAEERSGEKGKEKLDADAHADGNRAGRRGTDDGSEEDDQEEMQQMLKELVIDLAALNGGKAVQLEPEFDFFVADEYLPRNAGHAARPVFFDESQAKSSGDDEIEQQLKAAGRGRANVFWDETALPPTTDPAQAMSFGPARPSPFFQLDAKSTKKASQRSAKGMEDGEAREVVELERLLEDGFLSQEQYDDRVGQLKESIRLRKALAKQRNAELKRFQREEERLWEERDRKLMLERHEEELKLSEQKKQELTRAVLQDFLEGRMGAKELAMKVKSGVVTVEQLLGLWKTELRPLRLADYYSPSSLGSCQPGPSKHSRILADVMYLLAMSNPAKQHSNTIEPAALPQTREVLAKVEKIAAHNPGLVRKFAHYVRTEREMRTEWQRDVQERLLAV